LSASFALRLTFFFERIIRVTIDIIFKRVIRVTTDIIFKRFIRVTTDILSASFALRPTLFLICALRAKIRFAASATDRARLLFDAA